ncbi:hypothetical protein QM012_008340 [Aureobasidium pullulans]|uniref:Exosome complex protein n=1 Tax=Aureobasidium pullulans TaxID=5580 RepID=A0ABR0TJ76_AURPU
MAETSSSTTEIPFRAADGVSRFFLFEALRTGCEDIGSASAQLESARDKAEKMLVKDSRIEFDSLLQEILESCVKSLQTHAAIVEAVAETMNGDAKQSNEPDGKQSNKYRLLVDQIKDAAAGVEQLRSVNAKKDGSPPPPTESDFDSEPEVQSSKKPKIEESNGISLKTSNVSSTSAPANPTSDPPDEKPMKGKGKKLGKPLKPSKVSNASSTTSNGISEDQIDKNLPPATPKPGPTQQSFIDEEDINAEVDARLAAKELKRAKKKQAKKRKRDSVASDIFSPDPKAEPEHRAILPAKKKARIDKIDVDDGIGKRQNVDDALGGKAKAKKQKTGPATEKEESTVEANKAKRRRSSNISVTETAVAPEVDNRKSKKRRVGV